MHSGRGFDGVKMTSIPNGALSTCLVSEKSRYDGRKMLSMQNSDDDGRILKIKDRENDHRWMQPSDNNNTEQQR